MGEEKPEEQDSIPIYEVGPLAEGFEENLRQRFTLLGSKEPVRMSSPSYVHLKYGPMPGESLRAVLLKALLAQYDQRVPARIRRELRRFLRSQLPKLFFKRFPQPPGPVPALSPQERSRIRSVYRELLKLYQADLASLGSVQDTIRRVLPSRRRMNVALLGKLESIIAERSRPPFDRARDTLAAVLGRSRETVDKLLLPKKGGRAGAS